MKICLAQIKPYTGDIKKNIEKHLRFIEKAVSYHSNLIFFPELSLTGYEPTLASKLATGKDDGRFECFREICDQSKITIGVGMPFRNKSDIFISTLIFQPGKKLEIYSKQLLHEDELPYFKNGNSQVILEIESIRLAPAICYESLQPEHSQNASDAGAEIYLASVAKSRSGVDKACTHYQNISKKYSMAVLMSNSIGYCDNFESAGKSAIWNKKGELLKQLSGTDEGILIYDTLTEKIADWIE